MSYGREQVVQINLADKCGTLNAELQRRNFDAGLYASPRMRINGVIEPMQVARMRPYSDNDDYVKYLGHSYSTCLIVVIKSNGRHLFYVAPIGGAPRFGEELKALLTNGVGTEFISGRPLPARSQLANILHLNEALLFSSL